MSQPHRAPWTAGEVESLNAYQAADRYHPFTCGQRDPDGTHHVLVATPDGWRCPKCGDYAQDWCHRWMADWSWES